MGLFNLFKKSNSIPKYRGEASLPDDLQTLYRMARFYGEPSDSKPNIEINYDYSFVILTKLIGKDVNNEFMAARKLLGQQYMTGRGCAKNIEKGVYYYDMWMRYFLTNEANLIFIDNELRTYFEYGFHNYEFLLNCAEERIRKDKINKTAPVGMGLYELFLPIWLYSEVSKKMNFYSRNIKHYLLFLKENFGEEKVAYFAEPIGDYYVSNRNFNKYIDNGNILAIARALDLRTRNGEKDKILSMKEKQMNNYLRLEKIQEKHDEKHRFTVKKDHNAKLKKIWDFFFGPNFEVPQNYPFPYGDQSLYKMRIQAEERYMDIFKYRHVVEKDIRKFFDAAYPLLDYNHGPAYLMYANVYANYRYRDERIGDVSYHTLYNRAKNIGYAKAINLNTEWDKITLKLADKLGIKSASDEIKKQSEQKEEQRKKQCIERYQSCYENGNYDICYSYYENGWISKELVDLPVILQGYLKILEEQVGKDADHIVYRGPVPKSGRYNGTRAIRSAGIGGVYYLEDEKMNKLVEKLRQIKQSYNEPMVFYWLGMRYYYEFNYAGAVECFEKAFKYKEFSYYYKGALPEEMVKKIESWLESAKKDRETEERLNKKYGHSY